MNQPQRRKPNTPTSASGFGRSRLGVTPRLHLRVTAARSGTCPGRPVPALGFAVLCLLMTLPWLAPAADPAESTLVTLDPGHFHAALFQKEMLPGLASESFVYAPLGPDLTAHLNRVAQFNARAERPTNWRVRVYAGSDYLERFWDENPGQIVVLSGRNRGKIDRLLGCVRRGWHVLADKPWIIEPEDLAKLETALREAAARRVTIFDAMTQRFEITDLLARALVRDPGIFGRPLPGSPGEPAVLMESLHYLRKEAAGVPVLRPAWFFDIKEQGEGLSDVGTHLVDLVAWMLFPDEPLSPASDIEILAGRRWSTPLSGTEFKQVTGEPAFPAFLLTSVREGRLEYFANNTVDYALRGVHVRLQTTWEFAAPPGVKDSEHVVLRGTRARLEIRQGPEEHYRPEVFILPHPGAEGDGVPAALRARLALLQGEWPGLALAEDEGRFRLLIPDRFRLDHEAHFTLVARRFLEYARNPGAQPGWEHPNLLAKYYVTTKGVQLARRTATHP